MPLIVLGSAITFPAKPKLAQKEYVESAEQKNKTVIKN
jgi:hypothetical protein